ncbi:MAG: hypothetical protein ACK5SI_11570 [Planctomycetia bacterium]|jgi:hypothetical protein
MLCQRCNKRDATVTNKYADGSPTERFCDECASVVMGTPLAAHRFSTAFSTEGVLRITFTDGDVFRLQGFQTVHPTIYGDADRWNASIVQPVRGKHLDFARLFRPGSGLDFNESDITEIFDEASSTVLFAATDVA